MPLSDQIQVHEYTEDTLPEIAISITLLRREGGKECDQNILYGKINKKRGKTSKIKRKGGDPNKKVAQLWLIGSSWLADKARAVCWPSFLLD